MNTSEKKQFLALRGRALLDWSVASLLAEPALKMCMIALPEADLEQRRGECSEARVQFCQGGATRADSVLCALKALSTLPAVADDDWVLVHDGARPCLPYDDLQSLINSVLGSGIGGLLAQPVTDTLKRAGEGSHARQVEATIPRDRLWRAQTPQMFRLGELRSALTNALTGGVTVTDEASAMELFGHSVQLVEGSAANLKVTVPQDLVMAEFLLAQSEASADAPLVSGAHRRGDA